MVRFFANGTLIDEKTFRTENDDIPSDVSRFSTGECVIVDKSVSEASGDIRLFLKDNNIPDWDLPMARFDSEGSEGGNAIVVRQDGKILVAGRKKTSFLGRVDSWLLLTDQQGIVSEEAVFPFNFGNDQAAEIINSSGGGFVLIAPVLLIRTKGVAMDG